MSLINTFCKTDFDSYEDFLANFKVDMPESFNFAYDVVDRMAADTPDKTALVWCDDKGDEKIISFAEMKRMSDKAANALKSIGIKKGDVVMAMLKRRFEYWYLTVAMHKLGAVLIPATHLLTVKDLVYRIGAADVKMIITAEDYSLCEKIDEAQTLTGGTLKIKALLFGEKEGYLHFNNLIEAADENFTRPTGADAPGSREIMIAYFTSGTTGMPKMVAHDYYYPLCHLTTARFWHGLNDDDLHLTVADTGWAKASWGKIYGQWICGAAVFVYDFDKRFTPSDFLTLIDKYKITSFCAPPTIYRFLIKEDLSKFSLKSLKKCTIAGEPLNPEVYYQWLEATGLKLREGYGQTECTIMVATTIWDEPKPGSMGHTMPGPNCVVLDAGGNECEPGEEGELCMRVPDINNRPLGLFMGYYKDEEKTRSVLHGGIYHTGDAVWRDEDNYIWFKGRNDDMIKSSGYRIGPFEVESALVEHPAVMEAAVTGVPDELRGFNVKATIILAKGYTASDALVKELKDHVKKVTAPYKYPRIIEFVTELPKTISGKTRRVEIRERDKEKTQEIIREQKQEFLNISARIREMRDVCGFTVQFMAKELGIDAAAYEKYEAYGENIPISALYHMANLFKVDMSEILEGRTPRIDTYCVVPKGQGVKTERYPGYDFRRLAHTYMHKIMEPMIVTVEPEDHAPSLVNHKGQEFNLVLEGSVMVLFDGKELLLEEGDSIYFNPAYPHGQKAMNGKPAKFLTVIAE
jgi:acetyl-CoA synthetase